MDTGVVEAIPTTRGFDERYVLLDDASFFEVSGPLAAEDDTGATLLRRLYRARARVLRIVYTIPVDLRSIDALAEQVRKGFESSFSGHEGYTSGETIASYCRAIRANVSTEALSFHYL